MLNKYLIKNKFSKSLSSYDKNAVVQKLMAEFLISKIKNKKFNKILEIGSYTGILTKLVLQNISFEKYVALDIVDSFSYIDGLSSKISFVQSDIEDFITGEKFDLIISNASLQWVDDFDKLCAKIYSLLNHNGSFALSLFGSENLKEIKEVFGVGLKYYSIEQLEQIFKDCEITSAIHKIKFNSSLDVLKHLKYTGVNSVTDKKFSYKEIKSGLNLIENKFKNTLTYNPIYITNLHL